MNFVTLRIVEDQLIEQIKHEWVNFEMKLKKKGGDTFRKVRYNKF